MYFSYVLASSVLNLIIEIHFNKIQWVATNIYVNDTKHSIIQILVHNTQQWNILSRDIYYQTQTGKRPQYYFDICKLSMSICIIHTHYNIPSNRHYMSFRHFFSSIIHFGAFAVRGLKNESVKLNQLKKIVKSSPNNKYNG